MPARVPPPTRIRSGGGFGGFAANPSIPYSGGRVLVSDVQQAADALNFGGPTTEQTVPAPSPTATATPAASPSPVVIDPSGTGFVNSSLFQGGEFGSHNTVWFNNPTAGGDVEAGAKVGADNSPMIATRTPGRPPPLVSDPNADWTGSDAAPNTARNDGLPSGPGGMEDEPNLLGGDASGPTVDVSGRGGGLPSPYWNQPAAPRYTASGSDMRNFGGTLALGQFLNTPLAALRFGTDRFEPGGQITSASQPPSSLPPELAALPEATFSPIDVPPTRSDQQPIDPATGALAPPEQQDTASGQPSGPSRPTTQTSQSPRTADRITTILQAFPSLNNPAAIRALGSGANPSDLVGHAQFDSHAAGLMEMAFQSFGGNANDMGTTTDRGHDIFYANAGTQIGMSDEDGNIVPSGRTFQGGRLDPRWVFPSQAESWRLGLSYSQNADKYNAWLRAHNPWYYGPNGVLAQNAQQLLTGRGG